MSARFSMNIQILLCFFVLFQLYESCAQIVVDEVPKGLYYERTMRVKKLRDMKDMRDVFHYDKLLLGRNRIMGNISFNTGRVLVDDGTAIRKKYRAAIGLYTRIRFFEEFSFNTTFFKDFNRIAATRWIADFNYAIGRYNWRPNKFNYGYENYSNNKYSDSFKTLSDKFLEGYYFVSYSHNLSNKLTNAIRLDHTTNLKFTYFTRYAIHYRDENEIVHGGILKGKPTWGGGFRFTIYKNIYVESAVYFYFNSVIQKQPWDPDYTYGFGFFDWRSFRCSVTYGNWAINRFPWNKTSYPIYGFIDGNFRFVVNYIW